MKKIKKESREAEERITRREAILKMGHTALTASVMMVLLNSPKARATSTSTPITPPTTDNSGQIPWD